MTTTEDTRVKIDERYSVAIGASNLRVSDANKGGQIDVIMAAATASMDCKLGMLLMRLRAEYDAVKCEIEHAENARLQREAAMKADLKELGKTMKRTKAPAEEGKNLAMAIRERYTATSIADQILILSQLKTRKAARDAVGAYAIRMATKHRFMRDNGVVLKIAGRVLDVLLQPTCRVCHGTKYVGAGYVGRDHSQEKMKVCSACKGTGHRRDTITNAQEQWFAFLLLGDLQREMAAAGGAMVRKLKRD